jgi:hypothetical protein
MGKEDLAAFNPFGDPEKTGPLWKQWKRNFLLYIEAKDIGADRRKLAKLLFMAGPEVQKVYEQEKAKLEENDSDGEIVSEFQEALQILDKAFLKQNNEPLQRSIFRRTEQKEGESVAAFVVRLREQAQFCNFGNQEAIEKALKDQLISGGSSSKLRREMLKKERTLQEILQLAQSIENVDNFEKVNKRRGDESLVCEIETKRQKPGGSNDWQSRTSEAQAKALCWACNRPGHRKGSQECPAKGKKCLKCNKIGHFSIVCKGAKGPRGRVSRIRAVGDEEDQGTDDQTEEYVFQIGDSKRLIKCRIGGVDVEVLIDSGTRRNLITVNEWEKMKRGGVKTLEMIRGSDVAFKAYGQNDVIPVKGRFKATLKLNDKKTPQWFYVVERGDFCLLGALSSTEHGVLQVGLPAKSEIMPFPKIKGN